MGIYRYFVSDAYRRFAFSKYLTRGFSLNKGEACIAGSRIFVQEGIYDEFIEAFANAATMLQSVTGDPFSPSTNHGPQASKTQFEVRLTIIHVYLRVLMKLSSVFWVTSKLEKLPERLFYVEGGGLELKDISFNRQSLQTVLLTCRLCERKSSDLLQP